MGQLIFEMLLVVVGECFERGEELVAWARYKIRVVARSVQQRLR